MSYHGLPEADMRRTCTIDEVYSELAYARGAIASFEQRNRELMRQVEQLLAQVNAVRELIEDWRGTAENFDDEEIGEQYSDMADAVEAALTAPLSSSDPGRADTGREER